MTGTNNTLFLLGGTGSLGMEIAKGLITATGYDSCKAIVRNKEKAGPLAELGWTLIEVTDFYDATALEVSLQGARTIVSTFGGGDMAKLETATLQAAKSVGASVFVPSQFGVDHRRWNNPFPGLMTGKSEVLQTAKSLGIPTLSVFCGYFSDYIFGVLADPVNGKAKVVGDGSWNCSFIRRSDIGYVLAKALSDPKVVDTAGGTLSLQGEAMSWKDALAILEQTIGKPIEIEYVDPSEALKQEQDLLAKAQEGDMGAFYGALILHLLGEPARGSTGADVSDEANNYGVKLETLKETIQDCYGTK